MVPIPPHRPHSVPPPHRSRVALAAEISTTTANDAGERGQERLFRARIVCFVRSSNNDESRRACWTRRRGVWQFVLRQITRRTTSRGPGHSTVAAGRSPTGRTGHPLQLGDDCRGPTRVVRDADASRRTRRIDPSYSAACGKCPAGERPRLQLGPHRPFFWTQELVAFYLTFRNHVSGGRSSC